MGVAKYNYILKRGTVSLGMNSIVLGKVTIRTTIIIIILSWSVLGRSDRRIGVIGKGIISIYYRTS